MNLRTRAYRRSQRNRKIAHRRNIVHHYGMMHPTLPNGQLDFSCEIPMEWYKHPGQYSKGKIHCGCGICKYSRKFGLPTLRTIRELAKFKSELQDASV